MVMAGEKKEAGDKTPVVQAKRLSHVALKTRDVEAQTKFYEEMVGLGETARDEKGRVYLRTNERHHSLILVPSEKSGGLDHFSLEVGDGEAGVEAAADALSRAGIKYEEVEDVLGQGASLRMRDLNGLAVELIGKMEVVSPNYGPRAVQPLKQDHMGMKVPDTRETAEFYEEVFGFKVSDRLSDHGMAWMRCNPQHHTFSPIQHDGEPGLHHLSFELLDFAELAHQAEHLMRNGRQLLWGPGRHGPGNNQFEYFRDLDGNIIELNADAEQIWDPDREVRVWHPDREIWINLWGPMPPEDFLDTP